MELRRGSPGVVEVWERSRAAIVLSLELEEAVRSERVFLLALSLSPWSTEAPVEPERSRQPDRR